MVKSNLVKDVMKMLVIEVEYGSETKMMLVVLSCLSIYITFGSACRVYGRLYTFD